MNIARLFGGGMARKVLSVILAVTMVVSFMPIARVQNAYADTPATTLSGTDPPEESWYSETATELTISTAAQLAEFADIVNGTHATIAQDNFAGKTVTLANDIALAQDGLYTAVADVVYGQASYPLHATQYVVNADASRWTAIGSGSATSNTNATTANAFAGTFDGANHTVSGLYMGDGTATTANTNTVAGLFGVVTGTVKNVTVSGCITAKMVAGGIVAHLAGGTVQNCTNNAIVFADGGTTPAGGVENGTSKAGAIGGIVGNATTGSSITSCTNNAAITCANTYKGGRTGGIVGLIDAASAAVTVSQNANTGAICSYQYAGGIVGYNYSTVAPISSCSNSGTITACSTGSAYAGGIVSYTKSSVSDCYNTGTIEDRAWAGTKGSHLGGIVSDIVNTTVTNCYSIGACAYYCSGTKSDSISSYGAICGTGYGTSAANALVNCYALEDVAGEDVSNGCVTVKPAADMKTADFVAALNGEGSAFNEDASTPINNGYPVLAWQGGTPGYNWASTVWAGGLDFSWYDENNKKTEYHLTTPAQWEAMAWICSERLADLADYETNTAGNVTAIRGTIPTTQFKFLNCTIYLDNDIDMGATYDAEAAAAAVDNATSTETYGWSSLYNYYPVGSSCASDIANAGQTDPNGDVWYGAFWGSFDGQGHVVKNIYCNRLGSTFMNSQMCALFGRVGDPDGEIKGQAGVDAPASDMVIKNVAVTGFIQGGRSCGGIVGKTLHVATGYCVKVMNCINFATVKTVNGAKGVGGVVGALWNGGTVYNCANFGHVVGTWDTANVAGVSGAAEAGTYNSYNVGSVVNTVKPANSGAVALNQSTGLEDLNCYALEGSCPGYTTSIVNSKSGDTVTGGWRTLAQMQDTSFLAEINGTGRAWVTPLATDSINTLLTAAGYANFPVPRAFSPSQQSATVTGVQVTGTPELSYIEGETIDFSAMSVKSIWSDNTTDVVDDYKVYLDGVEIAKSYTLTAADNGKKLTIGGTLSGYTYGAPAAGEADWTLAVAARTPQSITSAGGYSTKYTYAVGQSVAMTTAYANVNFDNGLTEKIYLNGESADSRLTLALGTGDEATPIANDYAFAASDDGKTLTLRYTENGVTVEKTLGTLLIATVGQEDGTYLLDSEAALKWFSAQVTDKSYRNSCGINARLTADITVTSSWTVIANGTSYAYLGTFDGQGHTVTFSYTAGAATAGLFGYIGATGVVQNVIVAGTITSTSSVVGGVANYMSAAGGKVVNCGNLAAISSSSKTSLVGGIVGSITAAVTVSGCYNAGAVTGGSVGGILGKSTGLAKVSNCYNTGEIKSIATLSSYGAGGIAGQFATTANWAVSNCYNAGTIAQASTASKVGALVGLCAKNGTISDSYYLGDDTTVAANASSTTIVVTKTNVAYKAEADMKDAEFVDALNGESGTAWKADASEPFSVNGGYPVLAWQAVELPSATITPSATASDLAVGDTLTVEVTLSGADLAAARAGFDYNELALQLVSVTAGSGLAGESLSFVFDEESFSFTGNTASLAAGAVVAVLTFECIAATESTAVSLGAGEGALSGQTYDIDVVASDTAVSLPVLAAGLVKGDVNNNARVNIVDAQIVLDMANGIWTSEGSASLFDKLLALEEYAQWTITSLMYTADVNNTGVVDATDARAIQVYMHTGSWGE